ncbi:hypothetical protein BZL29_7705 [Mycobacterium kansasii]|uniref:Uncharacterized protein n=1 Tax=Mycobacterium kansasii TaxID=1768 RepID=A0A1V3WED3_MYCKA|nr:hypothetical protein BZL29_7705 [Mycobacterium kansasii]
MLGRAASRSAGKNRWSEPLSANCLLAMDRSAEAPRRPGNHVCCAAGRSPTMVKSPGQNRLTDKTTETAARWR